MRIIDNTRNSVFDYSYDDFKDYEIIICVEATQEWWKQFKKACLNLLHTPFINDTPYETIDKHVIGIDYVELNVICDMHFSKEVPNTPEWEEFVAWGMRRLAH